MWSSCAAINVDGSDEHLQACEARKRQRAVPRTAPVPPPAERQATETRQAPVRKRMHIAKVGAAVAAVAGLSASMALARVTYAGHSKHAIKPLAIPQPLYDVVRKNLLTAGILAPATAPPDAATSTS